MLKSMDIFDEIDIIISTIEKEWYESMESYSPIISKIWDKPLYSKSQISKAGKILAIPYTLMEKDKDAIDILNNWRASHAYPLQVIASNLRRNNQNAIVIQRLKRLDSIIGKLQRFPEMNLSRMQDLGGCRVIVNTIDEVYSSLNKYKISRIRHILKRENDYIKSPKLSGYRSYHMVYQFQSDTNDAYNNGMLIEIQFRTKLQHTWATAVEMMGVYTKSALKSSIGDEDILRFFTLVSSVFAKMENMPVVPNTTDDYNILVSEIRDIDNKLNIVSRLSALSTAINHVNNKPQTQKIGYYILMLNYKKKMLRIYEYPLNKISMASKTYNAIESKSNPDIDAVLVSATSFDALKMAYPNYFTDISGFVEIMRRILA